MVTYQINPKIRVDRSKQIIVHFPGEGRVLIDPAVARVIDAANGKTLPEVLSALSGPASNPQELKAALACLVKSGILEYSRPPELIKTATALKEGVLVSAVIVAYNSWKWLSICLDSLKAQTYAPIECIVVDNASTDGSFDHLTEVYPWIRLIRLAAPLSLAAAWNQGIKSAVGELLILLNQDIHLDPDAVGEMVLTAQRHPDAGAIAPKIRLFQTPAFLNGIGNQVSSFSWGWDNGLGHLDLGQFDLWSTVPSACFACVMIPRRSLEITGTLDEGYPMYYEDSDWSFRARLNGFQILAAPAAVVYHGYAKSSETQPSTSFSPDKLRNVTYGRLRFAFKILSPWRLLPSFLSFLAFETGHLVKLIGQGHLWAAASTWQGWKKFLAEIPEINQLRRQVQKNRKIGDQKLFGSQKNYPSPLIWNGMPELTWDIIQTHYLAVFQSGNQTTTPEFMRSNRPHLLILSQDLVGEVLAGPGLRYLQMAVALSNDIEVTLAIPNQTRLNIPGIHIESLLVNADFVLNRLVDEADMILVSTYLLEKFPRIAASGKKLVVDLYDPFLFENLFYNQNLSLAERQLLFSKNTQVMTRLLRTGDFFICGNERQRDFWLGALASLDRVNPASYEQDHTLRKLIDVVGIGLPDSSPAEKSFLRGSHPAIPADALIVLWGGGIWDWLDPVSLINAWPAVLAEVPRARLVFLGARHPNPDVPAHKTAAAARRQAEVMGELDKTILFFDWISLDQREALLSEANVGVVLHEPHVETHFAIRTRVFDYFWAGLPTLITAGDSLSILIAEKKAGSVIPSNEPALISRALINLLGLPKQDWEPVMKNLRQELNWNQVLVPLREYCLKGWQAAAPPVKQRIQAGNSGLQYYWLRSKMILRQEGFTRLVHRLRRGLQTRFNQLINR